jgi:hypothetical protein
MANRMGIAIVVGDSHPDPSLFKGRERAAVAAYASIEDVFF